MKRGDASFTFLDRIQEIEWNIRDGRWQSALALALTLPDICGGIAFPELVKKYRDGRPMIDKYGNPTRDIGNQYIQWFNIYAAPYFKRSENDEHPYICGERCWQLRCEYLHQNKGFVNLEEQQEVHFHLGINCGTSICQLDESSMDKDTMDIRLDIEQMCLRFCQAARAYYEAYHEEKDFSLYNTPVIDFVKWSDGQMEPGKVLVIVMKDLLTARGMKQVLESMADEVYAFEHVSDAQRKVRKRRGTVWMVDADYFKRKDQPWFDDDRSVVFRIENRYLSKEEKQDDRVSVIRIPCDLGELRQQVYDRIGKV